MNLLNRILQRRQRQPNLASGPRGHRAYAVGDVHGRLDLLEELLARIEADSADAPKSASLIFLGDLVDRGPASAEVVERLRTLSLPGIRSHFIAGNHEEVMLRVIAGDADLLPQWLKFGGVETLASYGVDAADLQGGGPQVLARIRRAIPSDHVAFLEGFDDSVSFGDYLFVHAGVRPGVDLSQQSQDDLRWIREPFISDQRDHGFVVVHGHTIRNSVEVLPNRIGIDTGAYATGVLTALVVDEDRRWLLQTGQGSSERVPLDG